MTFNDVDTPTTDQLCGSLEPEEIYNEENATMYLLVSQKWNKLGGGQLTLIYDPKKKARILLNFEFNPNRRSVINNNFNQQTFVLEFQPKLKAKNDTTYILKGKNMLTNKKNIIAINFKSMVKTKSFKKAVDWVLDQKTNPLKSSFIFPPTYELLQSKYTSKPWECFNCLHMSKSTDIYCIICKTPRAIDPHSHPITDEEDIETNNNSRHRSTIDIQLSLPECMSFLENNSSVDGSEFSETAALTIYGRSKSPMTPLPTTKTFFNTSQSLIVNGNDDNKNSNDISLYDFEFRRLLNNIHLDLDDEETAYDLYDRLAKIAHRLVSSNMKYRKLMLNNSIVKEKLLTIIGVEEYLNYLGFIEDKEQDFLICPKGEPDNDKIFSAKRICIEFQQKVKEEKITRAVMKRLSSSMASVRQLSNLGRSSKSNYLLTPQQSSVSEGNSSITMDVQERRRSTLNSIKDEIEDDGKLNTVEEELEIKTRDPKNKAIVRELVWGITDDEIVDNSLEQVLLLCFPSFASSIDVIECLEERYMYAANNSWEKVRIKTVNMLIHWMKDYWHDFVNDEYLVLEKLQNFRLMLINRSDLTSQMFTKTFQTLHFGHERKLTIHKKLSKPNDILGVAPPDFHLEDQSTDKMAEQLSLMLFEVFCAVNRRECIGQAWAKKDREQRAPNLLRMIEEINDLTKWVQVIILRQPKGKRWKMMKKCINIAWYLKDMRNFSSCCAINTALQSAPIFRLKSIWKRIPKKNMRRYEQIHILFTPDDHDQTLRRLHRKAQSPAILHIALFLKDLILIEASSLDAKLGTVNFSKLKKVYEKIDTLCMYQQECYKFIKNPYIQETLRREFHRNKIENAETLYAKSQKISVEVRRSGSIFS